MAFDLVVVGSLNHDLTVRVPRQPQPGETVLGRSHHRGAGGKGANQAVAAARLGASVAMVGKVGDDVEGRALLESLQHEGVDTSHVAVNAGTPTGLALVTVDDRAENSIVVVPGANAALGPKDVVAAGDVLESASVVLTQLEIPVETVSAVAEIAGERLILNPAPATALPHQLLQNAGVLVPNRTELGTLAGVGVPSGTDQVVEAVRRLPTRRVVVTLGAEGALVFGEDGPVPVPSAAVEPVDSTGAGDAFCAALAVRLAEGDDLVNAASYAVIAGAVATTRLGALEAMPTRDAIEALFAAG